MFVILNNYKVAPKQTEKFHLPYQNQKRNLRRNDRDATAICDRKHIVLVSFACN